MPGRLRPDQPIAPMEPVLCSAAFDSQDWLFQVKWDGVRCLAHRTAHGVYLYSRRQRNQTRQFPDISEALCSLPPNTVLDGEAIVTGSDGKPDFYKIHRRVQARAPGRITSLTHTYPASYMVFDVLWLAGTCLLDQPLTERLHSLDTLPLYSSFVHAVDSFGGTGRALFDAVTRQGMEGVVAKVCRSRYLPGRKSPLWKKIKAWQQMDVLIGGWTQRQNELRSLLMGVPSQKGLRYMGAVSAGLTNAGRRRLLARFQSAAQVSCPFIQRPQVSGCQFTQPVMGARIRYLQTSPNGQLRDPVVLHLIEGGICDEPS